MTPTHTYLAIDLGAESGRAIAASLADGRLALREAHRFENHPVRLASGLHWDVLRLWREIKAGISAAVRLEPGLEGIGLDTWGVDFALLDRDGELVGNPVHYRDARTDGMLGEAFQRMPRQAIFEHTGIQFMQINTLFQLLSLVLAKSSLLEIAERMLTMADLFNYWLSGEICSEFTIATTTQCFNPRTCDWAWPVLDALGVPRRLFQPVRQPGSILGPLHASVVEECGAGRARLVAPACHDTGSAVVAVPAEGRNFAWISSGTWSILGAEARQPSISTDTLNFNFTNEGGVFGTWRLCTNITGLWLVQECKRAWLRLGEDLSYGELTSLAEAARPFVAVLNPDDEAFLRPGDMPARIQAYCQRTGQAVPQSKGEIVRVALEGLALKYRWVLERLDHIVGSRLEPVHIIGGGTKNQLLNQFAADATGRSVIAGPAEATATGNILMQAIGLGHLGSLEEARRVVRQSFSPARYEPSAQDAWQAAYAKLCHLLEESPQT